MNKAQTLIAAYDDLTWENYVDIADSITTFDKHAIDDEMTRQASVYSYYQGLLSIAKKTLDVANLNLTESTPLTLMMLNSSIPYLRVWSLHSIIRRICSSSFRPIDVPKQKCTTSLKASN